MYFARRAGLSVKKEDARDVINKCDRCQSIDPAPVRWPGGNLSVEGTWDRVGIDIAHYNGMHFLTLIDHGPSRFSIWRPIRHQDSFSVIKQLENIFCERGPPIEILADNDTAFRSAEFERFAEKWAVRIRFRCAHVPSGNGITERCHRTVKRIAARKECDIQEAAYWYNVTPRDDVSSSTAPGNVIYRYELRARGIDCPPSSDNSSIEGCPLREGDWVWVKPPGSRCTTQFRRDRVAKILSDQAVEVSGVPRHVRDLRRASDPVDDLCAPAQSSEDDDVIFSPILLRNPVEMRQTDCSDSDGEEDGDEEHLAPRRSLRDVRPPERYGVIVDS